MQSPSTRADHFPSCPGGAGRCPKCVPPQPPSAGTLVPGWLPSARLLGHLAQGAGQQPTVQKEAASGHFLARHGGGKHCKGMRQLRGRLETLHVSLPAPCSAGGAAQTLPGTLGCCPCCSPPAQSTGHPLCPDEFWIPSRWASRLGKTHLEMAFGTAACRALKPWVTLAAAQPRATSPGQR